MPFPLPNGVVDVWLVDLDADEDDLPVLSREENARAERFRRPEEGRRWRRARDALRRLLAAYVDGDPRTLVLATARHGKPFLAEPLSDVRFNVSHAGAVALLAFARRTEVGVDVERRARPLDPIALARRAFGDECAHRLETLAPAQRRTAFLRAWVRHEAILKCHGTGLGASTPPTADVWVADLDAGPDSVAAVAAESGPLAIRFRALRPGDAVAD